MTNLRATTLALAVVLLATAACTKHDEAGQASGVPPLANAPAAPAPAAAPPPPPAPAPAAAQTQPERSPAPPGGASAGGAGPSQGPASKITGKVVVAASMKSHIAGTDTIYIVARRIPDNPSARGSLVAVKKVSAAKFPIEFELSAADMPFQNGAFDGDLQLWVRDNKSGDPIVRRKGDVFGMDRKS